MNKTSAIGIFDSGIGVLTVGHQITKLMPNERIVYFGDTKHLPYGDKSPDSIVRFSKDISSFLLKQKCKMIVVACNTASAIAFNAVEKVSKGKAIAINVIDPVVDYTCKSKTKAVGIIGTKNTILSKVYATKIKNTQPKIITKSLATPLLVNKIIYNIVFFCVFFLFIDLYFWQALKSNFLFNLKSITLLKACKYR